MRYRGNGKTKKQHGMIKGLRQLLEKIETWDEVKSIVPGRIQSTKASRQGVEIEVKYHTRNGLKAIAYGESVQELFFTSDNPDKLEEKLKEL